MLPCDHRCTFKKNHPSPTGSSSSKGKRTIRTSSLQNSFPEYLHQPSSEGSANLRYDRLRSTMCTAILRPIHATTAVTTAAATLPQRNLLDKSHQPTGLLSKHSSVPLIYRQLTIYYSRCLPLISWLQYRKSSTHRKEVHPRRHTQRVAAVEEVNLRHQQQSLPFMDLM